jgi:hypothetical protein
LSAMILLPRPTFWRMSSCHRMISASSLRFRKVVDQLHRIAALRSYSLTENVIFMFAYPSH